MSRLFWLAIAAMGAALIWLISRSEDALTFGLDNDRFAHLAYLAIWGAVLAPAILFSAGRLADVARNLAIWLFVVLVLVAGYQYRYDLQDAASTVTSGLVPGSPLSLTTEDGGHAVVITRSNSGHFEARALANGQDIRFLVDTGATTTVLAERDAKAIGIDTGALRYTIPVSTANGQTMAARAVIDELKLGPLTRGRVPVLVATDRQLRQSLLGMNFLNTLSGLDIRRDRMVLRD